MPRLSRSLTLGLAIAAAALYLLVSDTVGRIDQVAYDTLVKARTQPANPRVLIIAIDEWSLRRIGRWPWSRRVHARLLEQLTASGAAAVGFDILFSEPDKDDPEGDAALAAAIETNGRVVLVVGPEEQIGQGPVAEVLPLPDLAAASAGLGHIDFELDADGIARSVYLHAGLGAPHWPIMGMALLEVAEPDHPALTLRTAPERAVTGTGWVRSQPALIPFAGPPGSFDQVSYSEVLEGGVPEAAMRDRIVMIGATAVGLGDVLSTPLSQTHTLMPGIEVNANVLGGLLDRNLIRPSSLAQRSFFNIILIVPLFAWLLLLPSRHALIGLGTMILLTLGISAGILIHRDVWIPPTIPLLSQVVLFMLWSWLDLHSLSRRAGQLSQQIRLQARHDRQTGLPNQVMLEERLVSLIESDRPGDSGPLGLMVISVDRHRAVGELTGQKGVETLMRSVAERILGAVPLDRALYRLGGTDFAILVEQHDNSRTIEAIASRLVQSFQRPFGLGDHQLALSPSLGASRYPADASTANDLLDHAYSAMHRAREDQSRNFHFHSSGLKAEVHKRLEVELSIRAAFENAEFECQYQPQFTTGSARLIGVETLVRWTSPRHGPISPAEFIPAAERQGLIVPIGMWILEQACLQGVRWSHSGIMDLRIAVNVSAAQLESPDFVESVERVLALSGLPADRLELEITETALLGDFDAAIATLSRLKDLGVDLAIDDFGTGYSSLSYLQRFPMDRLKIDQSFITDVETSSESAEITRSVIEMAHRLGLGVIAEGVENEAQHAFLRAYGCEEVQGYLFARPMPVAELETAVENGSFSLNEDRNDASPQG